MSAASEERRVSAAQAVLAGTATLLGALLAEGLVAAASRPSYRAALSFGAPWRLLAPVLLLGAAAGLLGWLVSRHRIARGRSLAVVLLISALPVLVHALLSPPTPLLPLLPGGWAGAPLLLPLLIAVPFARGRALPAVAALLSALQAWWLLHASGDQSPPGAPADAGWLAGAPAALRLVALVALALLASLPLLLALRDAPARDTTRRLLAAVVALLLALAGGPLLARALRPGPAAGETPGGAPPILLVVADTLRADHAAGASGAEGLMPRVAELARDGVSFTAASAPAPWTTPSFGSLLTGRLPLDHGAGEGVLGALRPDVATLAEGLAGGGRESAALLTNPLLGRQHGLARGFTRYEDALPPEWYHPLAGWIFDRVLGRAWRYLDGQAQAARALEAVDEAQSRGHSWLVLAHFMDTHWPYASGSGDEDDAQLPAEYATGAAAADAALGALIDGLRARGLYERTLIVFTADHGEELLERRHESADRPRSNLHGHTLHEELLHVPLVIKLPAGDTRLGPPGSRRDEPVSLLDLSPTLLELAGELPPPESAGRSLLQAGEETLYAEALLPTAGQALCARRGPFKVVVHGLPPRPENAQGFDLRADPGERRPLPPTARPELSALYEALVVRWLRLSTGPARPESPAPATMDEDERRKLRQLGYLR